MNRVEIETLVVSWAGPLQGRPTLRQLADLVDGLVGETPTRVVRRALPAPEVVPAARRLSAARCSEPGCTKTTKAKGMCMLHYDRARQRLKREAKAARSAPAKRKAEPESASTTCKVCGRPARKNGLCGYHKTGGPLRTHADVIERRAARLAKMDGAAGSPSPRQVGAHDAEGEQRVTDCDSYNDCLGYVTKQKWPHWTCAGCPLARRAA